MTFPLTMGGRYLPVRDPRLLFPSPAPKPTPDQERQRLAAMKRIRRAARIAKGFRHG